MTIKFKVTPNKTFFVKYSNIIKKSKGTVNSLVLNCVYVKITEIEIVHIILKYLLNKLKTQNILTKEGGKYILNISLRRS